MHPNPTNTTPRTHFAGPDHTSTPRGFTTRGFITRGFITKARERLPLLTPFHQRIIGKVCQGQGRSSFPPAVSVSFYQPARCDL